MVADFLKSLREYSQNWAVGARGPHRERPQARAGPEGSPVQGVEFQMGRLARQEVEPLGTLA